MDATPKYRLRLFLMGPLLALLAAAVLPRASFAEGPRSLVTAEERLFVACGDPIRLFQVSPATGGVLREFTLPDGFPSTGDCGLSVHRFELFLAGAGGQVAVFDTRTGQLADTRQIPAAPNVTQLGAVPNQGLLFGDDEPETPAVFIVPGTETLRILPGADRIHGFGGGPLGRLFGWNNAGFGLEEIHEITGNQVHFLSADSILADGAEGLAFTGRTLFFAGLGDDLIKVIDARTGEVRRAFPSPLTPVCGLAASPREPRVVFLRSDRFPFSMGGAFRSPHYRDGTLSKVAPFMDEIETGQVLVYADGADPASAEEMLSFDYSGQFGAEIFAATLTEASFPSPHGIFHLYGVGVDSGSRETSVETALKNKLVVVLDSVAPEAYIQTPEDGAVLGQQHFFSDTASFSVEGVALDEPAGIRRAEFLVRAAGEEAFETIESREFTGQNHLLLNFLWDPPADGDYDIAYRAYDRSDNLGMSEIHRVTVDRVTVPPNYGIPLPSPAEVLFASPPLEIFGAITPAELDGDPEPELVFGVDRTGADDVGTGVYAINLDGSTVEGNWPLVLDADVRCSPAVADLDLDGMDEVVVGTYGTPDTVLVLDHHGAIVATATSAFSVISSPAIGNLDDDLDLEIVVGTSDGTLIAIDADGEPIHPAWPIVLPRRLDPLLPRNDVDSSPALGDLDGDGDLEIVVLSDDGVLYAYHTDGSAVAGFPFAASKDTFGTFVSTASNSASPLLADVDGDGGIDVVVAMSNARVYGFRGDGTPLDGFPLRLPPQSPPGTPAGDGDEILSTPAVGDVDRDGLLELVVAFYLGMEDESRLFVYDLPGPANCETMPWPTFQRNAKRTGRAHPIPNGDVNRDGVLNLLDFGVFINDWYRNAAMPGFHPEFDFDYSKRIDGADYSGLLNTLPRAVHPPEELK